MSDPSMRTFDRPIPVRSIVQTELERNGSTRSECVHNQCVKSLTETAKIDDLGLEFRQHSPPSWCMALLTGRLRDCQNPSWVIPFPDVQNLSLPRNAVGQIYFAATGLHVRQGWI